MSFEDEVSSDQTPQEEAADWANWLDRFERYILPVFERRGYSKNTAATIYFQRPVIEETTEEEG